MPPPFPLVATAWNPTLKALSGCAEGQAGKEGKGLGVPAWGSHIQGVTVGLSEGSRTVMCTLAFQQPCCELLTSISSMKAHSTPGGALMPSPPFHRCGTLALGHHAHN